MDDVLRLLLETPPAPASPLEDAAAWWAHHRALAARHPSPALLALAGGLAADRPAWAFASGYQAALRALVPGLPAGARAALCATEEGAGAHPTALATRLEAGGDGGPLRVHGEKTYVTLGTEADVLLVVASEGREEATGRNRLRLVRVDARAPGVRVEALPPAPLVPELPHARLSLAGAPVEELLPGDGYARYLKPFRTVEDCHVHAALLAFVLQVARRCGWPAPLVEALAAHALLLHALCGADPTAGATHRALGGALALSADTLAACEAHWASADAPTRARWERDRRLLQIAGRARAQRLETARARAPGGERG
jgi:alkylation response protein AidB-like acyl-CoA dehydrogenase